jgi:PAS domain S-box-containing protein
MNRKLHILILDDVRTDAELMVFELTEAGLTFSSQYASDKNSFLRALEDQPPDVILSDYSLPSFDGLSALKIAQKKYPEIPFIFVSGALGEEMAVELLKQGATDYILKDRLTRLAPAVSRAVQQVEERAERRRVEQALKDSELHYQTIFENTGTATIIIEEDMTIVLANKQFEELTGFSRQDMEGRKNWQEFIHPDDLDKTIVVDCEDELPLKTLVCGYEFRMINRSGDILHVMCSIALIPSTTRRVVSLLDITMLRKVEKEKREAALYARSLIEASLDPLVTISSDGKIMDVNEAMQGATGLSREMLIGSDFAHHFKEPARARAAYVEVFEKGMIRDYHLAVRHVSGRVTDVLFNATPYRNETGNIEGIFGAARDITERLEAEKKILANNALLRTLSSELVMTEERERRRIAVDLHDNIGQTLAMTKIKLNAMLEQAASAGLMDQVLEILEMVDQSIDQTRLLTRELSPSVLYELGLHQALEWLGDQIIAQHGFNIRLKNNLKSGKIDKDVQIFIYRSIRELIFNIIKHTKVKDALVTLQKSGENIRISVRDEGCGFDISNIDQLFKKSGGFGLLSIRERLNYIGGSLKIETKKGWGTCVEMIVPPKKRKNRK